MSSVYTDRSPRLGRRTYDRLLYGLPERGLELNELTAVLLSVGIEQGLPVVRLQFWHVASQS